VAAGRTVDVADEPPVGAPQLPQTLREQARGAGDGWLDEVVGDHPSSLPVPISAVKGSWRLNAKGLLTGKFVPNPRFGHGRSSGVCPLHVKR